MTTVGYMLRQSRGGRAIDKRVRHDFRGRDVGVVGKHKPSTKRKLARNVLEIIESREVQ